MKWLGVKTQEKSLAAANALFDAVSANDTATQLELLEMLIKKHWADAEEIFNKVKG